MTWFVVGVLLGLLGLVLLFILPPLGKQEPVGPTKGEVMAADGSSGNKSFDGWGARPKDSEIGKVEGVSVLPSIAPEATLAAKMAYYKEKDWYYLDAKRTQQGPIAYEDLRLALRSDRISEVSLIWCEGWEEWKHLSAVPELVSDLAKAYVKPEEHV